MAIFKTIVSVTRDTTANWNRYPNFVPKIGEIIVYLDRYFVDNRNVADIKVGDGVTTISNLPFIGDTGETYITIDTVRAAVNNLRNELGELAFHSTTVAQYTPEGSVTGTVFNGLTDYISMSGTPEGSVSLSEYTPSGTVSKPNVDITKSTDTMYVAGSSTGGGSVVNGQAASCVLPQLSISAENETLNISWTVGSFTANTPTQVVLPSFTQKTAMTDVSAELDAAPVFSGDDADISATFTGNNLTIGTAYTPYGTISGSVFRGKAKNIVAGPSEE